MAGGIPGAGVLQAMKTDSESGHPLRTRLRGMLGLEDPGEPAPWQAGGQWHQSDSDAPDVVATRANTDAVGESTEQQFSLVEQLTDLNNSLRRLLGLGGAGAGGGGAQIMQASFGGGGGEARLLGGRGGWGGGRAMGGGGGEGGGRLAGASISGAAEQPAAAARPADGPRQPCQPRQRSQAARRQGAAAVEEKRLTPERAPPVAVETAAVAAISTPSARR